MRIKEVNGLINDLGDLQSYYNPMGYIWLKKKRERNLLTGKITPSDKDSVYDFYFLKIKWFKGRVKKLEGNLEDFKKAKIIIFGAKERIEIIYKDREFFGEVVYKREESGFMKEMRRQKRENAGLD